MTHEFVELAEKIVNRKHFDITTGQDVTFTTLSEAMEYLAETRPDLYQDYRRSVNQPARMFEESPNQLSEQTGDFVTLAETEQRNAWSEYGERIDTAEAFDRAARKHPDVYATYRRRMTSNKTVVRGI